MRNERLRRLTLAALLLALSVVLGRFFVIPIPWTHGYINLCDAGILIAALLLGPAYGTAVGGFGGMFLDLLSGYPQYALFSLIAHGLEGLTTGYLGQRAGSRRGYQCLALACGVVVMAACYFFSDSLMYHTWMVGILSIGGNLLQGVIGGALALWLTPHLRKRM
ncbi:MULTISPECIES: ECF transporter S component [Limosilactobacillus]|uniref:ECF transporter S component n=1 Tax=Limosilactobacillus pontis TaxID=35787 RepID=A0ABU7SR12_9LACO